MAICPATLKPCIDDVCYGNGCLKLPSAPMLTKCNGCGKLVAIDGSNTDDCECDPDEWYGEDEEQDP
jgi:hypothetical protein